MSSNRPSSIALRWLASVIGYGDRKTVAEDPIVAVAEVPDTRITAEEVRRASAAVAGQPAAKILAESRRLAPMASDIVRDVGRSLVAGSTTAAISAKLVHEAQLRGSLPAMLGYNGFPAGAAVSVNDELLHGIPSERRILVGDLVKLEFGLVSGVAFAASSGTFAVEAAAPEDAALLECGTRALTNGVEAVSPGGRVGDIGAAIQAEVEAGGFEIVRGFIGHGMGQKRIQAPPVPGNGRRGTGARLRKGWILNLHVILKRGSPEIEIASDRWTALAADGQRGCIFTSMVEVTATGHRRLSTAWEDLLPTPDCKNKK